MPSKFDRNASQLWASKTRFHSNAARLHLLAFVRMPYRGIASDFAANVLPVIEQIKASGATSLR
jgi:hypothetical protein